MSLDYVGTELGLFARAVNWKRYVAATLRPWVRGRILDVGAGIGSNRAYLMNGSVTGWTALEPDADMAGSIAAGAPDAVAAGSLEVIAGTLADIPGERRFDTILYMDVLEHIEDDRGEVAKAARLLAPGGCLIVLAPAHQFLYSPFDRAIGHFRRYNMAGLKALTPPGSPVASVFMLDSAGFFASLANRMVLRASMPTEGQIAFWDRAIVPFSRLLDRITLYRFGKSVVAVWRSEGQT
jgi:SAM-dependent methyltransferase